MRSPWGSRQPEPFLASPTEIYAVALKKDGRFPFQPPDELHPEEAKKDEEKKEEAKKEEAKKAEAASERHRHARREGARTKPEAPPKPVRHRPRRASPAGSTRCPSRPGATRSLRTDGKRLYWLSADESFEPKAKLQALAIGREKPDVKTVMEGVSELPALRRRQEAPRPQGEGEGPLRLRRAATRPRRSSTSRRWTSRAGRFSFDPREEWRQMFVEAWRLERDYFYDRGMHGVDWPKIREKYEPLVDRVPQPRRAERPARADGGRAVGPPHLRARRRPAERAGRRRGGHRSGAELARDEAAGGWRVVRIYAPTPTMPQRSRPLRRDGAGRRRRATSSSR